MKIKQSIIAITILSLGITSVAFAAPTSSPVGDNIPEVIFGKSPVGPQYKLGEFTFGDSVPRVLSIGTSSLPSTGETLKVNGVTKIGSLSLATDFLIVWSNMTSLASTKISKTPTSSTDGVVTIQTLTNSVSGDAKICVQKVNNKNKLVLCP